MATHPLTSSGVIVHPRDADLISNTELAACLCTLGFAVLGCTRLTGDAVDARRHPQGQVAWTFAPVSDDGRYRLGYVLARWRDEAWLTDPTNADPLAYIICAFTNRRRLLDYVHQGTAMVAINQGRRWALIPEDCSARVETLATRHLKGQPLRI